MSIAQGDRQLVGRKVDERGAEEQTAPHIGLVAVVVGIEIDAVAGTEIGQEILALVRNGERDDVVAAVGVVFHLIDNLEVGVDVAELLFFSERQVPKVGHASAGLLPVAQARGQLLAIAERQHAADIRLFERRKAVNGRSNSLGLRFDILLEEFARKLFFVERVGIQLVENRVETLGGNAEIDIDDAISQRNGLVEEFLVEIHGYEPARKRIFRVEQSRVDVFRGKMKILEQNAVIEQQLHVVFLLLIAAKFVGSASLDVEILARFLLHEQAEVGGHQIDAPLQTEFFTDERGFEDGVLNVEC